MTDKQLIETAKTLANKYDEGNIVGETLANLLTEAAKSAGLETKDANTVAWTVVKSFGLSWMGETKASTFSRKRAEREYIAYMVNR